MAKFSLEALKELENLKNKYIEILFKSHSDSEVKEKVNEVLQMHDNDKNLLALNLIIVRKMLMDFIELSVEENNG